jgi:hypothetical protein
MKGIFNLVVVSAGVVEGNRKKDQGENQDKGYDNMKDK